MKLEGTYSSTSRSSWPIRLNVVPPQPAQIQAGSWVTVSRGRWAGSGVRTGCLRGSVLERLAVGLRVRFGRAGASVFSGSILFERADQQFELLDVAIELLRGAVEPRAPQHGQLQLQLLDVQRLGVDLGRVGGNLDIRAPPLAARN